MVGSPLQTYGAREGRKRGNSKWLEKVGGLKKFSIFLKHWKKSG